METKLHQGNPYITTAVYYLGFICLGMATAVLGPTLQGLAKNTHSTLAQISSLFLFCSFGYLLGSFTSGRIYDRVKGHPILCLALLIIASMVILVPLVKALLFLQVIFFIIGIAEGNLDVGIDALIVWLHGERVPPFMNGLHAFYGIGTTTAPLVVAAVIGSGGSLNSIYWVLAILILPVSLIIPFIPSPSYLQARQQAELRPAVPILVLLFSVIFFAFTGAELGFGGWIYTFATFQEYTNPTMAASINAAFWAALTVGRLVSIPLIVKLKPQKMLGVNFCGIIISLLIIIFFSSNEVFLWIGTVGTGFFMGPIFPTLLGDAQSRMHMSGKITSLFFASSSFGSMVVPWIMGQLIVPYGATAAMITVMCSVLIATGTFYILNRKQRTSAISPVGFMKNGNNQEG
jgi:MFS transporter, FHS family, Na+ dependent glucose transporter 1